MRTRIGATLRKRSWLIAGAGLISALAALALTASGATFGLLSASLGSPTNSLSAGVVTLANSSVANCPVSNLLPNGTAVTCTFTTTYPGPAPAYLAVNVLVETQAGTGGTALFNPSDSSHDLQLSISSSSPAVTYTVPSAATTCPGGALSGSACYELDNEVVSTSSVTSATVAFSVSLSLPTSSPAGYQGGAAQVVLTTHAVQSLNNTLSCTATPAAGSPCPPSGSFSWH